MDKTTEALKKGREMMVILVVVVIVAMVTTRDKPEPHSEKVEEPAP